jgi:hypothetical protein
VVSIGGSLKEKDRRRVVEVGSFHVLDMCIALCSSVHRNSSCPTPESPSVERLSRSPNDMCRS